MHERLLAQLLPMYGILFISSLSTVIPPEVGRTYNQGDYPRFPATSNLVPHKAEDWSCVQHVFETPHGTLMGQKFLKDLLTAMSSWDWGNARSL